MPRLVSRTVIATSLAALLSLCVTSTSMATWSITIADSETKEVAVGTVTCLTGYDLMAIVPVVVVGKGAGACQSAGDFEGWRRPIIFDQLALGTEPEDILVLLAGVTGHQQRQYGIADTIGRTTTFTGVSCYQWAGGVTGTDGTIVYAIQGNILTGDCVVPAIEHALLTTDGDIPAKLMAGMEAARTNGGDGRCSCSAGAPMSCGCPPSSFTKAGHIGGIIAARIGDADDPVCNAAGCADGDYFMDLNLPFQGTGSPDPVIRLRDLFDTWRSEHDGRPDAVQSTVEFDPAGIPPDGTSTATMQITLLDWSGAPISASISSLTVVHSAESAGSSTIGTVADLGGGSFSVEVTAGTIPGIDRFSVTVNDSIRPVILMPEPSLPVMDPTIPALTNPGMIVMALLVVAAGVVVVRRRRLAA